MHILKILFIALFILQIQTNTLACKLEKKCTATANQFISESQGANNDYYASLSFSLPLFDDYDPFDGVLVSTACPFYIANTDGRVVKCDDSTYIIFAGTHLSLYLPTGSYDLEFGSVPPYYTCGVSNSSIITSTCSTRAVVSAPPAFDCEDETVYLAIDENKAVVTSKILLGENYVEGESYDIELVSAVNDDFPQQIGITEEGFPIYDCVGIGCSTDLTFSLSRTVRTCSGYIEESCQRRLLLEDKRPPNLAIESINWQQMSKKSSCEKASLMFDVPEIIDCHPSVHLLETSILFYEIEDDLLKVKQEIELDVELGQKDVLISDLPLGSFVFQFRVADACGNEQVITTDEPQYLHPTGPTAACITDMETISLDQDPYIIMDFIYNPSQCFAALPNGEHFFNGISSDCSTLNYRLVPLNSYLGDLSVSRDEWPALEDIDDERFLFDINGVVASEMSFYPYENVNCTDTIALILQVDDLVAYDLNQDGVVTTDDGFTRYEIQRLTNDPSYCYVQTKLQDNLLRPELYNHYTKTVSSPTQRDAILEAIEADSPRDSLAVVLFDNLDRLVSHYDNCGYISDLDVLSIDLNDFDMTTKLGIIAYEAKIYDRCGNPSEVKTLTLEIKAPNTPANTTFARTANTTQAELYQNRPNPFQETTNMAFFLPEAQHIEFTITNINGASVYAISGNYEAGKHQITIDESLSRGIFYYSLKGKDFSLVKMMVKI